ncbi:MAG: UDP-N-acetylmuramoyl-tripeptide--D-alanyl-D-alanine ligase [Oscillospiraceae bacterium]|nr:UDP-N-acetylmuramoyl-tripeptide--D-alanyl-D-alanine ligase [Oscillospiraceae bacterium]
MQTLTVNDILRATGGEITIKSSSIAGLEFDSITTDSRKVKDGVLFIPLVGEKFDGHDFIKSAIEHGASAALTERQPDGDERGTIMRVKDTKKALGDIARYYKKKYSVPVVSITGSVGKTTTKDLIYAVLAEHYNTHKTPNNFNNDIGVPLTVFGIEAEHEMAVIEMGMNHFGEIAYLADIVKPDIAIITNIGMSHIENLGSQEGILKAKMEITTGFTDKNTLYVNGDDKFLKTVQSDAYKVVRFGLDSSNDVYAKDIVNKGLCGIEFTVVSGMGEFRAEIMQPGIHNVYNALAAVCAGMHFGVTAGECAAGLRNCEYTSQRLEVINHNGIEIINDCYNSSPDSVRAALKVQQLSLQPRKIAVLGDILEMGEFAENAHYDLGTDAAQIGIDMLITAGASAAKIAEGAKANGFMNVKVYDTTDDACREIAGIIKEGDSVLVKASHGMHFEKITEAIRSL